MFKEIFISTALLLLVRPFAFGQEKFTPRQLQEDLRFYQSRLERHHPNLYLYTSKQRIDSFFDSLHQSLLQNSSEAEFYRSITLSSGIVKDGHTLILPSGNFTALHNSTSKFLPLQLGLVDHRLYVKRNFTSTKLVEEGSVIESINGISSDKIIRELTNRQVRDGNNPSYANWILDTYFREYYSYIFGHPDSFEITFTHKNILTTALIPALLKDSIYFFRQKNDAQFNRQNTPDKAVYLNYADSGQTAVLTIKDFHSYILKRQYKQNFRKEIKWIFDDVISQKTQNLIIDLRNNQGGDVKNGVFLLSFLIDKPFKVVNRYHRIKNGKLIKCHGPSGGYHQPRKKQFKGKIYVLINGGSFSNSVIVSSCLREHSNAVFVGSESGGNPNVLAGNARQFKLPNTKIRVDIPTKQFVMTGLDNNNGRGLIPTYKIENVLPDKGIQPDKELDFVLKLIKGR